MLSSPAMLAEGVRSQRVSKALNSKMDSPQLALSKAEELSNGNLKSDLIATVNTDFTYQSFLREQHTEV